MQGIDASNPVQIGVNVENKINTKETHQAENVEWEHGGSSWERKSESEMLWDTAANISAYCPYSEDGIVDCSPVNGVDLLYHSGTYSSSTISLNMEHKLARLKVNVTRFGSAITNSPTVTAVEISGIYTTASFDGTTGELTTTGDPTGAVCLNNGKTTMLIPMNATKVTLRFQLSDDRIFTTDVELPESGVEAGKQYNVAVQVGPDHEYEYTYKGNDKHTGTCTICGDTTEEKNCTNTYSEDDNKIIEKCADCGEVKGTATITAAGGIYNGNIYEATVAKTGTLEAADVTVAYYKGDTLLEGAPVNAGTYTASITVGEGDNAKTASVEFTIEKATPAVTTKPAAVENLEYTGEAQTLITAGSTTGGTLMYGVGEGTDANADNVTYSKSLPTATDAGTYTVYYKVVGDDNYNEVTAKSVEVTIEKATPAVTTEPAAVSGLEYTGAAQTLVTAGSTTGGTLMYGVGEGTDANADNVTYSESLPTATDAGTYTVYYKVDGGENYNNVTAKKVEVTIGIKVVTAPTFDGLLASYVHTGAEIKPTFTLKDGETVIPASEYTVEYSNNTAIGTATITIKDVEGGNYTLPDEIATFTITEHVHNWTYSVDGTVITATCNGEGACPANNTATITLEAPEDTEEGEVSYDGTAKVATVTQNPENTFATPVITYTDANDDTLEGAPINVGTYTASITMGTGEAAVTASVEYTIDPVDLYTVLNWGSIGKPGGATLTLDEDSYVYTGSEIKPVPKITWNNMPLVEGKDYTLEYEENVNAGEAIILISGIGNYASSYDYGFYFTIEKADFTPATAEVSFSQNYTKTSFTVVLDDVVVLPANPNGWSYAVATDSGATIEETDEGSVLTAAITDGAAGKTYSFPVTVRTGNYKDYTFTIKLTLTEKQDQTISWNEDETANIYLEYGGESVDLSAYIVDGEGSGAITYTVTGDATENMIGEATVNGSALTPVHAGGIYVTAHKAADDNYNEASSKELWLYIMPIEPEGTMTIGKVTEAGIMLSDVEVTANYTDKDGNALTGTIRWYQWIDEDGGCWQIIDNPETYEVVEGAAYGCRFVPDNTNYAEVWMEEVTLWPSHTWSYVAEGNTITATCSKHENCVVVMSIAATGTLVYDGSEQGATINNGDSDLLDIPEAFYEMKNGSTWEAMTDVPVNAGSYRAGFTLGDVTAYVEYTVAKAPLDTSDISISFKSSVTYDNGNAVSVVSSASVPEGYTVYYSTSTNNRTWSNWTTEEPTISSVGTLYVKAMVELDDNHEGYETAVSVVRMTYSSGGGSGSGGSTGGGYYPPYIPSYPTATPTPAPTATPTPTEAPSPTPAPTEAPNVTPTVAPSATPTPVLGTVTVPTSGETVVDENGEEVTSIVQEPGTTNKLVIPGLTDGKPEEGEEAAPVIWESTNPDVAEVDENGNITMKQPGLAEIVVTVGEGAEAKTETIVVLVEEPRTYVNPLEEAFKDVRLGTSWADIPLIRYQQVGETVDINFWGVKNWKLDNYEYIWETSDKTVATVDSKGRVTSVKPGVFDLTLGLKNKTTGNFLNVQSVEIVIPGNYEDKILLGTSRNNTFESLVLNLNERIDINFYGVKNWKKEDYEYYWSSSEPSVVWVDDLGRLTPVNSGTAEVFLVLVEKKTGAPRYVVPVTVTVPEK